DAAAALGGFTLVTLLWLAPLVLALGPNQTPFGLFAGSVDQAAIATPFAAFTDGTPGLLLAVVWLSVGLLLGHVRHGRALAVTAVALSLLIVALPHWQGPRDQLTLDPVLSPPLTWLDDNFGTLHLYLPALAGWAGIAGLFFLGNGDGPLPWYVLFGTLAALTMYPRADTLHTIVSSPPVLVAAAGALAQLWRGLLGQPAWRRAGVFAALLLLPVAALAPQVVWRLATFVSPEDNAPRLDYQPLGLPTAPVLVPRQQAEDIRAAVSYVQAGTPPGAPLFVYPVAPLFNFLAQRPNPTRFDHFLPGTLTAADFDQTIDELQHARPRYVLWDHHGVQVWGTDPANRPLSDYLWRCYAEVAAFRPYLVLERRPDAC
ncbi:MAG TPA: hypothetical protein VF937_05915, partial [Chloroflexota bacterium]